MILALANSEVANVPGFEQALTSIDARKPVNVLVRRGEWAQYVLIRPQGR